MIMVKLGLGTKLGIGTLAALGIGLFIFRDKISEFFSGITGGAETVSNLGEVGQGLSENLLGNFTGLQDIFKGVTDSVTDFKFPTFEFPTIEFPTFEFPTFDLGGSSGDITETPAAVGRASDRGRISDIIPDVMKIFTTENLNVQTGLDTGQQFQGGGLSFIGGTVRETPITGQSTLGFIIDKLGVSASKAASIRAGLLGFTPEEENFLMPKSVVFDQFGGGLAGFQGGTPPAVSDQSFAGLTPQEIALRLTGGNISNF